MSFLPEIDEFLTLTDCEQLYGGDSVEAPDPPTANADELLHMSAGHTRKPQGRRTAWVVVSDGVSARMGLTPLCK